MISKFENGAYYCKTREIMNELLKKFEEQDIKWCSGEKATTINKFDAYNDICIYYDITNNNNLAYCGLEYAKGNGYKIINAKEFLTLESAFETLNEINKKINKEYKMERKFKVGDRVKCVRNPVFKELNQIGTIKSVNTYYYYVEFDNNVGGIGDNNKFVHLASDDLELVKTTNKIEITSDGKITRAILFNNDKIVKETISKCNPLDTFNFIDSSILAFNRLVADNKENKENKESINNETIKCDFKIGDSVTVNDTGYCYPNYYDGDLLNKPTNYKSNYIPNGGQIATIIKLIKHCWTNTKILAICRTNDNFLDNNCHDFIIGIEGIKKYIKLEFVPHLQYNECNYGTIGEDAGFTDIIGTPLKIGDTVTSYKNGKNIGEHFVYKKSNYCSVTSIGYVEFIDGIGKFFSSVYKIVKCRDNSEIKNGEKINCMECVKEI